MIDKKKGHRAAIALGVFIGLGGAVHDFAGYR
jgi:hypothetical protein